MGSQWLGNGNSIGNGNLWDLLGQPCLWPQRYKMCAHLGALDKAGDLQALAICLRPDQMMLLENQVKASPGAESLESFGCFVTSLCTGRSDI